MFHDLDFTDRRTRRDAGPNHSHRRARPVLTGEKDFYDPASPADLREYRVVMGYGRR
ncbi:hypothetical protein [Actinoplanes rectilineatus]|uniref:hypothetical protein n=1 Tax=Actinoplanes rectilineatus TaxID=113571 RepID=UPI000AB54EF9|nr:hypothetical protein [Actinoplanes rectilineatus]